MEYRKSTQEDLDYVRANPYEGAIKDYPYLSVPDENTITTIYEGHIVAVGGVQIKWPGRGLFWLILRDDAKKHGFHGVLALSAIREKVEYLIAENRLHRAEAAVKPDFEESVKMIRFLGFEYEGRMKKYYPDGSDGLLYAKVT